MENKKLIWVSVVAVAILIFVTLILTTPLGSKISGLLSQEKKETVGESKPVDLLFNRKDFGRNELPESFPEGLPIEKGSLS